MSVYQLLEGAQNNVQISMCVGNVWNSSKASMLNQAARRKREQFLKSPPRKTNISYSSGKRQTPNKNGQARGSWKDVQFSECEKRKIDEACSSSSSS